MPDVPDEMRKAILNKIFLNQSINESESEKSKNVLEESNKNALKTAKEYLEVIKELLTKAVEINKDSTVNELLDTVLEAVTCVEINILLEKKNSVSSGEVNINEKNIGETINFSQSTDLASALFSKKDLFSESLQEQTKKEDDMEDVKGVVRDEIKRKLLKEDTFQGYNILKKLDL